MPTVTHIHTQSLFYARFTNICFNAPLTSLRFLIFAHFRFKALSLAYLHFFYMFSYGNIVLIFCHSRPFSSIQLEYITSFVCNGIRRPQSSGQIFNYTVEQKGSYGLQDRKYCIQLWKKGKKVIKKNKNGKGLTIQTFYFFKSQLCSRI